MFVQKYRDFGLIFGDIFNYTAQAYCNAINCVGIQGKGIALAFKNKFPEIDKEYKKRCEAGLVVPGKMDIHKHNDIFIINFPTKIHWRDDSKYEYIQSGLEDLRNWLTAEQPESIIIPPLGCGLGGLAKPVVYAMICDILYPFREQVTLINF